MDRVRGRVLRRLDRGRTGKLASVVGWRLRRFGQLTALEREGIDKAIERARDRDHERGIQRSEGAILQEIFSAEEVPQLWPELLPIYHAAHRLGTDASGNLLHSERVSWLDENQVDDPAEREAIHLLFDALDSARAAARQELHDELMRRHR